MIFFLRHGKTQWNLEGRLQGKEGNSELLPVGENFIADLQNIFKEIKIDKIYRSPSKRVNDFVNLIKFKSLQIIICEELNEIAFGVFSGKKFSDIDKVLIEERNKNKWFFRPENGESYDDLYNRLNSIYKLLIEEKDKYNIVIIGHETCNKVLIGKLLNYTKEQILSLKQPNNIIYKLEKSYLYKREIEGEKTWEKL